MEGSLWLEVAVRSSGAASRLLAIGLVFIALGVMQWVWFEPAGFGQAAVTVGLVAVLIAVFLMARARRR